MLTYQYTRTDKSESLIVTGDFTRTVTSSSPRFEEVRDYLFNTPEDQLDADHVLSLLDAGSIAVDKLHKLSERVSYQDGHLYFDGDEVENALSRHIVRMIKDGDDNYSAFVNFLENLSQNPSKKSRKALFEWVSDRDLTITPEGHFVAYKGVNKNSDDGKFYSLHAGQATVNDELVTGHIPNEVGSVITMPRASVDSARGQACSTGLHVGTRQYALSYSRSGAMLIVAVNPRDVVMVPKDGGGEKMRVCRYKVLDTNEAELTVTTYYGWAYGDDDDEQGQAECCDYCGDDEPGCGC